MAGYVLTADSLIGISSVQIKIESHGRITKSEPDGHFYLVAAMGDTLSFTAVGFKTIIYITPIDTWSRQYTIIQPMTTSNDYLSTTFCFPFRSKPYIGCFFPAPKTASQVAQEKLDADNYEKRLTTGFKFSYTEFTPRNIFKHDWEQFKQAWSNGDLKNK